MKNSGHGYTPDSGSTGANLSGEDETVLHSLLLERREAQRLRNFAEADRLRQTLKEAGVTVNDKTRTYRIVP